MEIFVGIVGLHLALAAGASFLLAKKQHEKEKKKIRRKREWIKVWRCRRMQMSSFKLLHDELRLEDVHSYRRYLRMDETCFRDLLDIVSDDIKKHNTQLRDAIPPDEKLSAVLRFLATGETYRSLEFQTRLSLAFLSQTIPDVCSILYRKLMDKYLTFPNTFEEWKKISENFAMRWQFPLCLGALDGKHVSFAASKKDGAMYHNYKGYDSIVLLALTDADCRFLFIDVGCNGRISDGGVLNRSDLRTILINSTKYFPPDELIGDGRKLPCYHRW